jgi:Uma2 family endonuclease
MPALAATHHPRVTFAEFLRTDWGEEHFEWVDGHPVALPGVTSDESALMGFLRCIVSMFAQENGLGVTHGRPFLMKTGPRLSARAPDVFFVSRRRQSRIRKYYLDGPADMVIEVASRQSRATDRGVKYFEYEEGGVKEYWLIEQERRQAEFYGLGGDGHFRRLPVDGGILRSTAVKGLWINVDWMWRPPRLLSVRKAWALA